MRWERRERRNNCRGWGESAQQSTAYHGAEGAGDGRAFVKEFIVSHLSCYTTSQFSFCHLDRGRRNVIKIKQYPPRFISQVSRPSEESRFWIDGCMVNFNESRLVSCNDDSSGKIKYGFQVSNGTNLNNTTWKKVLLGCLDDEKHNNLKVRIQTADYMPVTFVGIKNVCVSLTK